MKIKHVDDINPNKSPNIIMVYCCVCRILSRFENELKTPLIAIKKVLMFYI